ncbi:hypothetical protein [Streptomyces sp. NPDC047981]|uniref:hypothetical protein n=1 Tax=Streptomyces sp. NPDC047981 TaxID=3154610 RepID=UPI0034328B9A
MEFALHVPIGYDYVRSVVIRLFAGAGLQEGEAFPELSVIAASALDPETTWAAARLAECPPSSRAEIETMLASKADVMEIVARVADVLMSDAEKMD